MAAKPTEEEITRFADMFSAMGTGPRLRVMRVLLSAHPDGMVVGDIGEELGIPASTLSHHLDKLKKLIKKLPTTFQEEKFQLICYQESEGILIEEGHHHAVAALIANKVPPLSKAFLGKR